MRSLSSGRRLRSKKAVVESDASDGSDESGSDEGGSDESGSDEEAYVPQPRAQRGGGARKPMVDDDGDDDDDDDDDDGSDFEEPKAKAKAKAKAKVGDQGATAIAEALKFNGALTKLE